MDLMDLLLVLAAVSAVAALVVARASRSRGEAWPVPEPTVDAETRQSVSELVDRGRKIEAIKALRSSTGLGLREAKERIDAWDPHAPGPEQVPSPQGSGAQGPAPADLQALATETREVRHTSGEVSAVKHVRERTGWGLVDAKRYVDQLS
ncbi:hypothetical protein [Serinicoccus sp. LYQ131]|uniref:hypothetical protein n=1 Tax=Serinicoccus sp. LYQ131 TaxID=3378797 RepID=UPI0038550845